MAVPKHPNPRWFLEQAEPMFDHDCTDCIFLGSLSDSDDALYDLYWCGDDGTSATVIARNGHAPEDNESGIILADRRGPLAVAVRRAQMLGLYVG